MFLFIFESIGTSELILVGIVALIFLGPRKLPELAKKAGKIISEFRGTANEFKQTWEKEVNFEEEVKSLSLSSLDEETVTRAETLESHETTPIIPDAPAIRSVDPESFKHLVPAGADPVEKAEQVEMPEINDKK
ncbi:MAG: Sec-independent protein translocase protein TatB, partial [Pyrinomonadaceae bacterium]